MHQKVEIIGMKLGKDGRTEVDNIDTEVDSSLISVDLLEQESEVKFALFYFCKKVKFMI